MHFLSLWFLFFNTMPIWHLRHQFYSQFSYNIILRHMLIIMFENYYYHFEEKQIRVRVDGMGIINKLLFIVLF